MTGLDYSNLMTQVHSAHVDSYLRHVMDQQQRYGDSGDVMSAADLQDVSQTHNGWVSCSDVP